MTSMGRFHWEDDESEPGELCEARQIVTRPPVTYTMDTAERYTFTQAKERLHRDMGRKWGAYALYHAGMDGSCTVGGTKVTRRGEHFTITDA